MPRFLVTAEMPEYIQAVIECDSKEEAAEIVRQAYEENVIKRVDVTVQVHQVTDNTPLGDVK